MKKLIILGTGGNCIDILDTINDINDQRKSLVYECVGFLDDKQESWGKNYYGVKVIGGLESAINHRECFFVNGIGSPFNFWMKKNIIDKTQIPTNRFETIIHPSSNISNMSKLGHGTVIFQNVTIASNVLIGNHVIILPNSIISHDSYINDYTCVAGGCCVSGGVTIGKSCYLGTNSSIIGNASIGEFCLVGMGSSVINNIESNSVVVGSPSKFLRRTIKN
jgi:sugar O-acyltransferase (sialic acid O-acetyltransferase NeuD family)